MYFTIEYTTYLLQKLFIIRLKITVRLHNVNTNVSLDFNLKRVLIEKGMSVPFMKMVSV